MANIIWDLPVKNLQQKACVYLINNTRNRLIDIISASNNSQHGSLHFDIGLYQYASTYNFATCGGLKFHKQMCCLNKIGCCDDKDYLVQVAACLIVFIVFLVVWLWICQFYLLKRHMNSIITSQKKTFLIGHLPVGQKNLSKPPLSEENLYSLPDLPKSKASKTFPLDSPFRQTKLQVGNR